MSTTLSSTLESQPAAATAPSALAMLLLDLFERVLIVGLFAWLSVRILAATGGASQAANLLILLSEGLVVLLVLIRRPATDVSRRPSDWLFALLATATPLLVQPGGQPLAPPVCAALLLLIGIVIQVHAKLVLGRSLGCVPANRGIKLSGPYKFVRHPMYAGYLLGHVAFLAMNPLPWNLCVYLVCYALQVPRLLAEERLLSREDRYAAYMQDVRYRLFPGVF